MPSHPHLSRIWITAACLVLAGVLLVQPAQSAPNIALQPQQYLPLMFGNPDYGPGTLSDPVTLVGAGDISVCSGTGDDQTAALLAQIDGTIFSPGDNSNESGTDSQYANCFNPSWGQHKSRIRPAPGNHDYGTAGAAGYYRYFGEAAGDYGKGYYSYNLGAWHVVVLNSNCTAVGGCGAGSPQETWLREDLANHPSQCTLAYWHHPYRSSGLHGNDSRSQAFWQALYDYDAEIIINGHDHDYERFAPQDPTGSIDLSTGIRQFVVGTGGAGLRSFAATIQPNSEIRSSASFGVLKLTLDTGSYAWEFIPVTEGAFQDEGAASCH